jgi:hypothetical protein
MRNIKYVLSERRLAYDQIRGIQPIHELPVRIPLAKQRELDELNSLAQNDAQRAEMAEGLAASEETYGEDWEEEGGRLGAEGEEDAGGGEEERAFKEEVDRMVDYEAENGAVEREGRERR